MAALEIERRQRFLPVGEQLPPLIDLILRHLLREVGQPRIEILEVETRIALEPVVERAHHRQQRLLVELVVAEQKGGDGDRLRTLRPRVDGKQQKRDGERDPHLPWVSRRILAAK